MCIRDSTYTDKEADGTDDLQLKLQDRDDIWLKKWLADAIDAAASAGSLSCLLYTSRCV